MKWLSILPILVAVPSILATDFRSKTTQIESLKNSPIRVESISELLKSNPYRQLLPENERNIPEPSYIIPSSSYVGQQFAAFPTQATSRVPTNFDPFAIYTTKSTSKPLLSSKYDIPSNMTTLFSATLPPMVKITRQPTTGKNVIRMSKFNREHDQGYSGPSSFDGTLQQVEYAALRSNAHISVPSHRLLNDILVIPSSRRLYVLAIIPIHESSGAQGFECGNVDVNAFLRLAAFLKSLDDVNTGSHLRESGLHIGAIVIDSCSSDLRTLADLYELFSGTNIDKSDIIAIIRDDKSYLPNIDEFANYLRIPTINTFFTVQEQVLTTGTLPTMEHPLQAILDLLKHTQSTCVSVVFDDLHAAIAKKIQQFTSEREMCLDEYLQIRGASSVETQQNVVRKLLLSEARIIIVLYGEKSWLDFLKALNNEMVISGRFVLVTLQDERWSTSRLYLDSWPHFDQLLISVTSKSVPNYSYLTELTNAFPKLPFPQQWLKQFWTMAFQCHIDGENIIGEQFSRPCPHQQNLNLSLISPDLNIAPINFAVHIVAVALRKISDHICPGALIQTLTDCLNDPYRSLFAAMLTAEFVHPLANERFKMNSTSGYTGTELVMNRVMYQHGVISYEEIAIWDFEHGLTYTSGSELLVEERDGSRVKVVSKCPKSSCSSLTLMKYKISGQPSFKSGLNNLPTLVFSIIAILFTFVCLLCIYQQLVSGRDDPYYVCTILMFFGLSFLSIVSVFFIMTPSWITCAIRRTCFSVAISFIFAPILVKTIMIWRDDVLLVDNSHKKSHVSPVTMFCLCIVIVLIQFVIVAEWAFFDDPTQLEFAQFNDKFSWRCFPGTKFEHYILHSMALNVFLIVSSLLCSTITIKATASRQHVVISVMALVFGIALYIVLPMLNFIIRDQFFAVAILTYAILNVILSYCKGAFCDSNDSNENFVDRPIKMSDKSSMMSLDKRLFVQPSFFGQSINNSFSIPRENATMYSQKVPLSYRSSVASEYRMSNFV